MVVTIEPPPRFATAMQERERVVAQLRQTALLSEMLGRFRESDKRMADAIARALNAAADAVAAGTHWEGEANPTVVVEV